MNQREIAQRLLEWAELREELDRLEDEIKAAVIIEAKSQVAGDVRASYSAGRKAYDYNTAGAGAPPSIIFAHTTQVVDWRAVCAEADVGIDNIPFIQSAPSVSLRLVKPKKEAVE